MAKNFGEILSNVSIENGQSVRLKSDGTAFEAYTPSGEVDATPDTDHTANGPTTNSILSGATISAFECVYLGSGGKWLKADADGTATADKMLAIALEAKNDTEAMLVALPGSFVRDDTWNWTVGGAIYLSTTDGALTQTAPSGTNDVVRVLGYAVSSDVMYFNPETGVTHT